MVTGFDEAIAVYRDHATFSSCNSVSGPFPGFPVPLVNGGANRDPRHFGDPDEFRVDRANARHHVPFGHGIHTCAGAPLARAEARVSLERLLDRTRDIRVSAEHHGPPGARRYDFMPTFLLHGVTNLHLELEPVA
jgi:cytochrome P450